MSNYFEKLPDFEYVSRLPGAQISDYIKVKNLFKKGVLREDITAEMMFFTKYSIKNNDRPDNVANDFYGDSDLDWLVLTCNNIVNIQDQWPKSQTNWFSYLIDKYDNESNLYSGIHHYETTEVLNQENVVIIPAGLEVESDYTVDYFDNYLKRLGYKFKNNSYCYLFVSACADFCQASMWSEMHGAHRSAGHPLKHHVDISF